jgi:signal transduction histidine kinase/CheY-like chemotaxis protein
LLEVIQELAGIHDLASVTRVVGRAVRALTGSDGASFVLQEGDLVYYADEDAVGPLWKGRRFPAKACISGWVILNRRQAIIPDIYVDPRVPTDAYRPTFVKSLGIAPIRPMNPIGALGAYWAKRHDATTREMALLQALANASAIAIANVELVGTLVRARREAEAARERAEAAGRVREEFLAMLGHELRNPLAPIVTALQIIAQRGTCVDREHAVIERQVKHLVHLVDDLLDVSRITRGHLALRVERVVIASIVERAVEEASPLLDARKHHFEAQVAPDLAVDGDQDRLVQVITNLLTNAAKYTPESGHLRLSAEDSDGQVVLRVEDDGIGITPDLLPRLFDSFVQAQQASDRRQGGLGLGLALVRTIVALHGGSVEARSEGPGRGSVFTVRLPRSQGTSAIPASESAPPPPPPPSARRVLVVDDNEDAAMMLGELLSGLGLDVQIAKDGPEALAALDCFTPDVALLDIGLPGMDGHELAMKIRERLGAKTPQMIAVTGYGQESDRIRSRESGFDVHLVKPVDWEALLQAIEGE